VNGGCGYINIMAEPAPQPHALTARGVPSKAHALLCVAPASVARTGLILRQVSAEARSQASTLMLDFSESEAELIASGIQACPVALIDADARSSVFPLGTWDGLPDEVANRLQEVFRSWLLPDGRVGHGRDLIEAAEALASLPFKLPRTSLYAWRRYFTDRGYRRAVQRALRERGLDPRALQVARPGTGLAHALVQRIDAVLGHDDSLDRLFPHADPAALTAPARKPELRVVRSPAGTGDPRHRMATLVFTQVLAGLALRPGGRAADARGAVRRLIIVEPPAGVVDLLGLIPKTCDGTIAITVVLSPDVVGKCPLTAAFAGQASIALDGAIGHRALGTITGLDADVAHRAWQRFRDARWLYVPQAGYPPERWCGVQVTAALPRPDPRLLLAARKCGHAFLVERARVVGDRRRVERAAEGRERRRATEGILDGALSPDRLAAAWRSVRRNAGGPGIDKVTVDAFGERWQVELDTLRDQVLSGKYAPQPYLRHWVKKESGGERPLGVAAVRDRVLMASAAESLSAILEPVFSDLSFAYRPGRGAQRAVLRIATDERMKDGWAVIADISSFFDSVDQPLLMAMLREHVADDRFLRLVQSWVDNTVMDQGKSVRPRKGVPQGSPVSPVLSNLYLTPLDRWAERRGLTYARYADDFVVVARSETEARTLTEDLATLLDSTLRLSLKPTKTQFVACSEGFDFLGFHLSSEETRINPARVADAEAVLATILHPDRGEELGTTLQELDAYVRGFRGYFSLGLPGPARQLQHLELRRRVLLEVFAQARSADLAVLLASSERFVSEATQPTPGSYGSERQEEDHDPPEAPEAPPLPTSMTTVNRTRRAVRDRTREAGRPVAISAGGHISVFGNGAFLALEGERLILRRKTKLLFEAPLAEVRSVHTYCFGLVISTPVLERLATRGVPVLLSAPGGPPWGLVRSPAAASPAMVLAAQLAAHQGPLSVEIARELVGAKMRNQDRMLRYLAKYKGRLTTPVGSALRDAAEQIRRAADGLEEISTDDVEAARRRVFAAEGRAAVLYWNGIKQVLGDEFPGRTGRGATDPVNMVFNYGYAILYAAVWAAVLRVGLDPGIGLLHASVGDRGSLVFDLIEPFRVPAVDKPLLGWLNRGTKVAPNKDGTLRTATRVQVATLVSDALDRQTPWGGTEQPLSAHLDDHALRLRDWLQGGPPLQALRMRW